MSTESVQGSVQGSVQEPYTAVQISQWCQIAESTIRNRWFDWLTKVAPEPLLKQRGGYTEMAKTLFLEFKGVPQQEREQWVLDAKKRYAPEWGKAGIIEGELMPEAVGGALATLHNSNTEGAELLAQEMQAALDFGAQLGDVEAQFSDAELEAMRLQGARRGIMRYRVEEQAAAETYNQLRQKGMGQGQ